jgi:hypothetical protein
MWWLSGLFRSVTLLARPPGAIDDVFVHADHHHTGGAGTLRVDTDVAAHLGEMHGEFVRERHVLGVAALDVRPELREAIPEQASVVVGLRGAVDEVDRIEVHAELPPFDRADELQVAAGRLGGAPGHGRQRVERPLRLDRVGVVAQGPVGGPEAMALHGGDPPGRGIPGPREWRAESYVHPPRHIEAELTRPVRRAGP